MNSLSAMVANGEVEKASALARSGPVAADLHTNGVRLRLYANGPSTGPIIVLLHGFPEIAFSWRFQFDELAQAGYRVIAPDLRGCGMSATPTDDAQYRMTVIVADVVGILNALGRRDAHLVGHDWGARLGWAIAQHATERVASLTAINSPWQPRSPAPPLSYSPTDSFSFLRFFASAEGEQEMNHDVRRALRFFLGRLYGSASGDEVRFIHAQRPAHCGLYDQVDLGPLPQYLDHDAFEVYVSAFSRTGFGPSLARYRNIDADWAETASVLAPPAKPSFYIAGGRDPSVLFDLLRPMISSVPGLKQLLILPHSGHAVIAEEPGVVTEHILAFIARCGSP